MEEMRSEEVQSKQLQVKETTAPPHPPKSVAMPTLPVIPDALLSWRRMLSPILACAPGLSVVFLPRRRVEAMPIEVAAPAAGPVALARWDDGTKGLVRWCRLRRGVPGHGRRQRASPHLAKHRPLVHGGGALGWRVPWCRRRGWCRRCSLRRRLGGRLVFLKDEQGVLADAFVKGTSGRRRAIAAVVERIRVLHLGETDTGSVATVAFLGPVPAARLLHDILRFIRTSKLTEFFFLLIPHIAPTLGHKLTFLAKNARHAWDGPSKADRKRARNGKRVGPVDMRRLRLEVGRLERDAETRVDKGGNGVAVRLDREPILAGIVRAGEKVFGVRGIGNGRQLTDRRRHGEGFCPWKGAILIELRRRERRRAKRLAFTGGNRSDGFLGTELVEGLVDGCERNNPLQRILYRGEGTLFGVDGETMDENLKRVLGHVWEHVKQRLSVVRKVGEQGVRQSWLGERVARKEHVEKADAQGPDVSLGRQIAGGGRIELLGGHVAVAAHRRLVRPGVHRGKAKVAKLHGTVGGQEDVLRLDVTMVEALGMHVLDSIDKLEHALTNVFRLTGSSAHTDGLVEVAIRTVLQDKVDVMFRLEMVDEVDNVRMVADPTMDCKFFRAIIDSKGRGTVGGSG